MKEWVGIPDFPLYEVSSHGEVRRGEGATPVAVHLNQTDIAYVSLMTEDGEQVHRGLARLVAKAYIPQDLEAFDTPIQLDGDRLNCDVSNLMWRPRWFAIQYHMQFKNRYPQPIETPLRDVDSGKVFGDSWAICTKFGLLEKDVVGSVANYTVCWPTYQRFQHVD